MVVYTDNMNQSPNQKLPTILFGAFDRHNFGDLLFPHIVAALLQDRPLLYAGLTHRDLRPDGGHQVFPIHEAVANLKRQPFNLIHVGGEILTCDNWLAAVMLLHDEQVQAIINRFDSFPSEKKVWAQQQLKIHDQAPYCFARKNSLLCHQVIYNGVGGVDLATSDSTFRNEIIRKLKAADRVSVRDRYTQSFLSHSSIHAQLIPDPAVMVSELFSQKISQACSVQNCQALFPSGYIAVQFSADFGDDKTLTTIAAELDKLITATGLGLVFFRAGAAPWHDDLSCYQRTITFMTQCQVMIFDSLNIWAICALISGSQIFCGSSLHGRIIAMAFGIPRINVCHATDKGCITKQAAFAETWDIPSPYATVTADELSLGVLHALNADPDQLKQKAKELASLYRKEFSKLTADLDLQSSSNQTQ